MKLKMSNGKIRGEGLFIVKKKNVIDYELVWVSGNVVYDYPNIQNRVCYTEDDLVAYWKKIELVVEDNLHTPFFDNL
jgi:hypothetical protein